MVRSPSTVRQVRSTRPVASPSNKVAAGPHQCVQRVDFSMDRILGPMEHAEAVAMLRGADLSAAAPQHWADLGCGTGTFTHALAALLPAGSRIEAMDKDARAIASLPQRYGAVEVMPRVGDLQGPLPWKDLDGILLANALHYVQDQAGLLHRLRGHLRPGGLLLIVEYERQRPNPWVPYPVDLAHLRQLVHPHRVERIAERPSVFGDAVLYAAVVRWA